MNIKILTIVLLTFVLSPASLAQVEFSIGGYAGGGSIQGNSPSEGSFGTSVFLEANLPLFEEVFPRLSFIYARDFSALIPDSRQGYFPFVQGFSFKGVTSQYFDSKIFLEEAVGLLMLNDRTFIDTDSWEYGIVLSFVGGFDLRNFNLKGFKLGAGVEYGLTFTGTLPQYFNLFLQFQFTL